MSRIYLAREGAVRKYLWLKAVTGVDLGARCARSLRGTFLPIDRHAAWQELELPPEHAGAAALYFCGVTDPFVWSGNDHVLLLPAPGQSHSITTPGYVLDVAGWRPQTFSALDVPAGAAGDRSCRNLQAAHWLSTSRILHTESEH